MPGQAKFDTFPSASLIQCQLNLTWQAVVFHILWIFLRLKVLDVTLHHSTLHHMYKVGITVKVIFSVCQLLSTGQIIGTESCGETGVGTYVIMTIIKMTRTSNLRKYLKLRCCGHFVQNSNKNQNRLH